MGNSYTKLTNCFSSDGRLRRRHVASAVSFDPFDESLGHSFAYMRPSSSEGPTAASPPPSDPNSGEETTTFRSISGAAVSANASTPLSTALLSDPLAVAAAAFESSTSFSAVPLQPLPRFSGPLDRGFMSGPIERGFMSGPLDHHHLPFSGQLLRSFSHGLGRRRLGGGAKSLLRGISKAIARTISAPKVKGLGDGHFIDSAVGNNGVEAGQWSESPEFLDGGVQWAQGKAGEDRVHVVVSEEHGWVFVGIYDGFNGPDATDYLLYNLYDAVHGELKGLLWDDKGNAFRGADIGEVSCSDENGCCREGRQVFNKRRKRIRGNVVIGDWERKISEIDKRLEEQLSRSVNHSLVLKALSKALKQTEETYLDTADKMVSENPELALMGSCVLVMLMKGDDVYLMSVGDSRAILAQKIDSDVCRKPRQDLERIREEAVNGEIYDPFFGLSNLAAMQLTLDHCTSVEEEVERIRKEHPDDSSAITNDRVKGSLKVTRAFGAGFLKQPKWNDVLLEMFRIDYVGTSAYLTCNPFLYHHKLGHDDKFLILSSDGLYQYLTNEEAVNQVEMFMSTTPEGDPAQHLVEEVLFRAAKRAGMEFHELLEVPQGDRRRYHDDISIIIISLEGRIWRSCL